MDKKAKLFKKVKDYYSNLGKSFTGRVRSKDSTQYGKKIKALVPHKKDKNAESYQRTFERSFD